MKTIKQISKEGKKQFGEYWNPWYENWVIAQINEVIDEMIGEEMKPPKGDKIYQNEGYLKRIAGYNFKRKRLKDYKQHFNENT
jgi:hypothetical protein